MVYCGDAMKNFYLSLTSRADCFSRLDKMLSQNPSQPYYVTVSEKETGRSISANNQQHLWYGQISKHLGDRSVIEVKSLCKDVLGLPILLNSDKHGDKIEFLLDKLGYYQHSYESKMKLIQCLEVTSLFNTAESKEYMEQMIFYWNDMGVPIKFKDK